MALSKITNLSITDDTIVNADIKTSAAIALSNWRRIHPMHLILRLVRFRLQDLEVERLVQAQYYTEIKHTRPNRLVEKVFAMCFQQ